MKKLLTILFLTLSVCVFSQTKRPTGGTIYIGGNITDIYNYLYSEDFNADSATLRVLKINETLDLYENEQELYPSIDNIRIYATEDADFTVLETITDLGVVNRINQDAFRIVRNRTGSTLTKGTVVRYSGSTGNKPNMDVAQADTVSYMPAIGILNTDVLNNAFGEVMLIGKITGIKTDYTNSEEPLYAPVTDWAEGDVLWVNSSLPGKLQNYKPQHPNLSQWMATIEVVHSTQGVILVKTQAFLGVEDGTNKNIYKIGNALAGTKSIVFDAINDGQIDWDGTGFNFGNPIKAVSLNLTTTPIYSDNAAAISGGLSVGDVYRTSTGVLMIVYTP